MSDTRSPITFHFTVDLPTAPVAGIDPETLRGILQFVREDCTNPKEYGVNNAMFARVVLSGLECDIKEKTGFDLRTTDIVNEAALNEIHRNEDEHRKKQNDQIRALLQGVRDRYTNPRTQTLFPASYSENLLIELETGLSNILMDDLSTENEAKTQAIIEMSSDAGMTRAYPGGAHV